MYDLAVAILPVTEWSSLKRLREAELRPIAPRCEQVRRADDHGES